LVLRTDPLDVSGAAKRFATDHAGKNAVIIIDTLCWHVPAGADRGLPGAVVAWRG
jgi:hypothetical protein